MSIIDRLFVALGFQSDTKGLTEFQAKAASARETIFSFGTALTALATGAVVKGIAKIGGEFESNQIAIAGFMKALDMEPTFDVAFDKAEGLMNKIIIDAAKLPGTAEEYVQVFRDALPVLKGAMPGASPEAMVEFSDTISAIGRSLKIDAPQIGRDLQRMLSSGPGTAGQHVRLFKDMLPFIKQVKGQANLTAQSFNALSQPQRLKLLQATFEKLQPMILKSAESWDAMSGAASSMVTQVVRLGTKPLFEGMKKGLGKLVDLFFDAKGSVTGFGKDTIDTMKLVSRIIVRVVTDVAQIVMAFARLEHSGTILKAILLGVTALIRPFALLGAAIFLVAEDLYTFYTGGNSLVGLFAKKWGPAIKVAWAALALLLGVFIQFKAMRLAAFIGKLAGMLGGTLGGAIGKLTGLVVKSVGQIVGNLAYMAVGIAKVTARIISMGVAWALANFEVVLMLAGIAAIIIAGYELWKHWDEIMDGLKKGWLDFIATMKNAPHDVAVALGFGSDADTAARQHAAGGGTVQNPSAGAGSEVVWLNPDTGLTETHRPGWKPPSTGSAAAGAGAGATPTQIVIQQMDVHSPDPAASARDVTRAATRNARSKVAY